MNSSNNKVYFLNKEYKIRAENTTFDQLSHTIHYNDFINILNLLEVR